MDDKDKKFGEKLEQNIEEKQAEQKYGAEIEDTLERQHLSEVADREIPTEAERRYHPLSEDEAKRMMREDARQTEANMKDLQSDKHKKTIIAVVVVAVVLCIGMLIAALMLGNRGSEDDNKLEGDGGSQVEEKPGEDEKPEKPTEAELEAQKEKNVNEIVSKMETALKGYLVTEDGKELFTFQNGASYASKPFYRAPDMNVAIPLEKAFGFTGNVVDEAKQGQPLDNLTWEKIGSEEYQKLIEKVFVENGFVKIGEEWTPIGEYVNWETGVICTNIGSGMPIYFGCGHISWLNKDEAELANELAAAYEAKEGYLMGVIDVSSDDIVDSKVKPYQRLAAQLYGAVGLFYRVSPEAKWQFFKGTQSPLGCSDYDTEDLKKAYAGEVCYDGAEEKVVEP